MMIRVLVVEDEPPIKRSIVRLIEQRAAEFVIAGTAMNGRQALELIEKTFVDAVFTDIRMPVMDGLELAKQIRTCHPEIEVIIISGYHEFGYMRQALVSQVTDYLLKPVTAEAMNPVLDKLVERVGALQQSRRRRALQYAVSGAADVHSVEGAGERYGVFLICAGAYPLVEDAMLPARAFWNRIDLEQQMTALLPQEECCMCFAGKTSAEMVVMVELKQRQRVRALAQALLTRLNEAAEMAVTVGSVDRLLSIAEIGAALKRVRQKLHTETRLFSPEVIWEQEGVESEQTGTYARRFERKFDQALRTCDEEGLEETMQACVTCFVQTRASQIQLVHFLESVLNTHSNLFDTQTANLKLELRAAVSNAIGADSLAKDLAYIFTNMFADRAGEEGREHEPPVIAQIERYMCDNFDKSITSSVLSERFKFVPSYISKLFRTHRGVSPSEYLTRYRIERAKELMEQQPELLSKEIAGQVGFSDQYYFSKIFKKETGMWPTEFAKRK